jgi:hypothetical protein
LFKCRAEVSLRGVKGQITNVDIHLFLNSKLIQLT